MKVKDLINYLNNLPKENAEKEVGFYDYAKNIYHSSPSIPTVVDESDDNYLDLVFNYNEK